MPQSGKRAAVPFIGGFESTFMPTYDVDLSETSGHQQVWQEDLSALRGFVSQVRYPIRWHRVEPEPGQFNWAATDAVMSRLGDQGLQPIVDLVHHTSYPRWLTDGLRDRRFGPAFVRFAEAVATRYPWVTAYTLFNEPFSTMYFSGHEGFWPPYDRGLPGFIRVAGNVLPALSEAAACWRELLPDAQHVWVDTCEHHQGSPGAPARAAELANDRRHAVLDLALGHDLDPDRPFLRQLLHAGGEQLFELPPLEVDVVGLDYYWPHEWWYDSAGAHCPSPYSIGFAAIAAQYHARYNRDLMLTETNLRGTATDRASWLRFTLEQYELAVSQGVPLRGYCWYPSVDSCDWDSLLARAAGRVDPVGVVSLDGQRRVRTVFTEVWEAAASGTPAAELPAYRFQPPLDDDLAGLLPHMQHWRWEDPPPEIVSAPNLILTTKEPLMSIDSSFRPPTNRRLASVPLPSPAQPEVPDLVVVSHLRWDWVWQRPQHLVSRFAVRRTAGGARTWFVEEPVVGDVDEPELRYEDCAEGIRRVWLVVPVDALDLAEECRKHIEPLSVGFDSPYARDYGPLLAELRSSESAAHPSTALRPDVMLYTPMAYDIALVMDPGRLAYDVMDDLASFLNPPKGLRLRQMRLLAEADVVFTGGRSLHRGVSLHRKANCHLFASGVDTAHYATSMSLRRPHPRPVAGYVGVLHERIDLELLAGLAAELPDWTLRVVGPVAKIDPADLPQAPNVEYPGKVTYDELPSVMAGFDVALMPFALNEATRSISPTKTLEYLAAGLPVVSTRVADVVADHGDVVALADTAAEFAACCRRAAAETVADRDRRLKVIRGRQEWDVIAAEMGDLIRGMPISSSAATEAEATA